MSHKIDAYTSALAATRGASRSSAASPGAASAASAAKVAAPPAADSIKLTGEGRYMSELSATIQAQPASSDTRVQRIRSALREGSYQIDAKAIARQLVRSEWELGNK